MLCGGSRKGGEKELRQSPDTEGLLGNSDVLIDLVFVFSSVK